MPGLKGFLFGPVPFMDGLHMCACKNGEALLLNRFLFVGMPKCLSYLLVLVMIEFQDLGAYHTSILLSCVVIGVFSFLFAFHGNL